MSITITWADWLYNHDLLIVRSGVRHVALSDMPPLYTTDCDDGEVFSLGSAVFAQYHLHGKAWCPPMRGIVAALLRQAWPGIVFVLPE